MKDADLWATVVGQSAAIRLLQAAVTSPVHAYHFVGPDGAGRTEAARAFAGSLFAEGVDEDHAFRHRRLAATSSHPDLVLVEPKGRSLLVADARHVITESWRSPVEADLKVVVVDRFDTAEPEAVASLLKTIEEPPPTVVFVLLAAKIPDFHATIASRCVRVDLPPLGDDVLTTALTSDGVEPDQAVVLAEAAAGSLSRARLLAEDRTFIARREAWHSVPDRLDGTGAAVAVLVAELQTMIDDSGAPLAARHERELAAIEEQEEVFGIRGSGRRDLLERQRRELRRLRDDELRFGLATLSRRYRDSVTSGGGDSGLDATARISTTAGELVRNPNERLLLQALFLDLPRAID